MNSRFFKLFRIYSSSLEMSKVGEFPWSWFLGTALKFRKRMKNSSSLVYASIKREIMHFHVVVVQRRQRHVQKSVMQIWKVKKGKINTDDSVRKAREPYLIKRGKTLEPLVIDKKDEMLYIPSINLSYLYFFYISNFFDNSFNGLCGSMGVFRSIPPKLEH